MPYNQADLDNEIRALHFKIMERRKAYNEGMRNDMPFQELKQIFLEIKELTKQQELCFEESKNNRKDSKAFL